MIQFQNFGENRKCNVTNTIVRKCKIQWRDCQQQYTVDLRLKFWPSINDKVRFSGHAYFSIMPGVS